MSDDDPAKVVRTARWLRKFWFGNVWFWAANHFVVIAISVWGTQPMLIAYLAHVSVVALWLSAASSWQGGRVETQQLEASDDYPTDDM